MHANCAPTLAYTSAHDAVALDTFFFYDPGRLQRTREPARFSSCTREPAGRLAGSLVRWLAGWLTG